MKMADSVANISTNDDSFSIAQELLEYSSNDQCEVVTKWIEKLQQIRQNLANRCFELADVLDATVIQHAEDLENCKQRYEMKLNEMNVQIAQHLALLDELTNENTLKTTAYDRLVDVLQSMHKRKCHIFISAFCFVNFPSKFQF